MGHDSSQRGRPVRGRRGLPPPSTEMPGAVQQTPFYPECRGRAGWSGHLTQRQSPGTLGLGRGGPNESDHADLPTGSSPSMFMPGVMPAPVPCPLQSTPIPCGLARTAQHVHPGPAPLPHQHQAHERAPFLDFSDTNCKRECDASPPVWSPALPVVVQSQFLSCPSSSSDNPLTRQINTTFKSKSSFFSLTFLLSSFQRREGLIATN